MSLDGRLHDPGMVGLSLDPCIVKGLEDHHHTRFLVIAKQLGVTHIMANRDAACYFPDPESAGVVTGRIEFEILAGAETFVVTVDYFSGRANHIDTVVREVSLESVRASQ